MNLISLGFFKIFSVIDSACQTSISNHSFLGIPPWYRYLDARESNQCTPELTGINDIWLIGLALIEILTRIAVFAAIGFLVYGGLKYSASRGNVEKVNDAKSTVIDALTGLVISIVATAVVSFVAGSFSQS